MDVLQQADPDVCQAIQGEARRQQDGLEMIASENYASPAVMAAQGSVLTNKYAEGYPGRRYYGGCEFVDVVERLAIERLLQALRRREGQRAAALRRPGEHGGLLRRPRTGRHHPGHGPGPRRPSDARHEAQLFRQVLQHRQLRRPPERRTHRLRPGGQAGPRAQAEAGHRRGQRLSARDRLRPVRRDLPGSAGPVHGGHGPHRRAGGRGPAHEPGAVRRLRHLDDAQDAARPARRLHPVQAGLDPEDQLGRVSRHAGRPAHARRRRQGGGLRRSAASPTSRATPPRSSPTPRRWPTNCNGSASASSRAAPTTICCWSTWPRAASPASWPRKPSTAPASPSTRT